MNDPSTTVFSQSAPAIAEVLAKPEQDLIRELHAAIKIVVEFYGSAQLAAPALGVSNAWLSRISPGGLAKYAPPHRLTRPQMPTLLRLAQSTHDRVREIARALLRRRGYTELIAE